VLAWTCLELLNVFLNYRDINDEDKNDGRLVKGLNTDVSFHNFIQTFYKTK
jgi:hypothetical protein